MISTINTISRVARSLNHRLSSFYNRSSIWAYSRWPKKKVITAMIRVKNEEDFLLPAVLSIVNCVDRIVIIDNQSNDRTPEVIQRLSKMHSSKISVFDYPHKIIRVGKENQECVSENPTSPNLLTSFYNFCLAKCKTSFVLKWDGDMIATNQFSEAVTRFRNSSRLVLCFRGANVHENRKTLIVGREHSNSERDVYDNWTQSFTDSEPRIFPRYRAFYDTGYWWCERLDSPFINEAYMTIMTETAYAHMKYCKKDAYSNMSPEFAEAVQSRLRPGPELEPGVRDCISRWCETDWEKTAATKNEVLT